MTKALAIDGGGIRGFNDVKGWGKIEWGKPLVDIVVCERLVA